MKNLLTLFIAVVFVAFVQSTEAQVKTPAASPHATFSTSVGLTDVVMDYSRPGVKGRTIFGELVPFGTLWRAGANAATTIEFSDDVTIKGKDVKAGKYSVFIIPSQSEWTFILNNDANASSGSYDEANDAVRVMVSAKKVSNMTETLTYDINSVTNNGAHIVLSWADMKMEVPFTVPTDSKVEATISSTMNGPSASDYYSAATYYHESGKKAEQSLKWINKAIEMNPGKFWMIHRKANILADMGRKPEAIAAAKESLKLAEAANYDHYIMLNKKLIAKLQ